MTLPPNARLHVDARWGETVPKYGQLPALQTTQGPGVLAMWIFIVYESNMGLTFLEVRCATVFVVLPNCVPSTVQRLLCTIFELVRTLT
jgi:hypothetical protein